ncbi:MAG TPA: FtsX-like permease family protein, partial [Acidimicrobiales bacterium]|nr:FtsX-like permease family protein [Acidimicrobiales bacterium]
FTQDALVPVTGRLADPRRADEIVMNEAVARAAGLHVGARLRIGVYTNAQTELPDFGAAPTSRLEPYRIEDVTLVGTVVQPSQLIEDDVDDDQSLAFFTPAFTRPLLRCCTNYSGAGLAVSGGPATAEAVAAEVHRLLPAGFPPPLLLGDQVAKAERSLKPESLALGVFGGIAALAALLVAAQAIGRQLRLAGPELGALRALGAGPGTVVADTLLGTGVAVVVGAVLAGGVAVALSPFSVLGPVQAVRPAGVFADWTVLGAGAGVLVIGLTGLALALALRNAPHRVAARGAAPARPSAVGRAAAGAGMPPAAVAGIRFALEPGQGRDTVPVRSAILGALLAVVAVVATVTFGASLRNLVSHPRLYGWNWDVDLAAGGGSGNSPQGLATTLLDRDRDVAAWSGAWSGDLAVGGRTVPVLGERPGAAVQPPVLSGHDLQGPDQVVLGATTLAQLHTHLGARIVVHDVAGGSRTLTVVGTATMPTLGFAGSHLEMGSGALTDFRLLPAAVRDPFADPLAGPEDILVDLRGGGDRAGALARLRVIADRLSNNANFGVAAQVEPLHPAEIVNYRSMGDTPAILGSALGAGAAVALMLTLVASVRRRRHDLALLKTLGFTGGQLAATVAWQSSVAVVLGAVVGVPIGIGVGRALWDVFAGEIHVVPVAAVPALSVALVAVGSLVLANLVAAVPGRIAARIPGAVALRAE